MTYRNPPLLAERLEPSSDKMEAAPHHRTNQETISRDKQGETIQTDITTPLTTIPDSIPPEKGLLINRNFTWLASGQAISNLGDFVFSTTLLIWVASWASSVRGFSQGGSHPGTC